MGTLPNRSRNIIYQTTERSYNPREVFETWLYAASFHRDRNKQPDLAALRTFEPTASLSLQLVVFQLAIASINLEALSRYLTGRPARHRESAQDADVSYGFI